MIFPYQLSANSSTCIYIILTHVAQSWSLTEFQKPILKITKQNTKLWGFKRIDQVSITMLCSMTDIANVGNKTAKLKWDWVGHIGRRQPKK